MQLSELASRHSPEAFLDRLILTFGVIYSIDAPKITDSNRPPGYRRKIWTRTEHGKSECGIEDWRMAKYTALLTREQFDEFLYHLNLVASATETMGSLGAPRPDDGMPGWTPAILFHQEDSYLDDLRIAYVTPYVMNNEFREIDADDWEALKEAIVAVY